MIPWLWILLLLLPLAIPPAASPPGAQGPTSIVYLPLVTKKIELIAYVAQISPYDLHSDIAVAGIDGSAYISLTRTQTGEFARRYTPAISLYLRKGWKDLDG
jgi:hypothetical protein